MSSAVQMYALVRDTFRESLARKIFWGFLGCSTALILFFLLALNIDLVEGAMAAVTLFGKEVDGGQLVNVQLIVHKILGVVAAFLFTAGLFLAVFASAGLIPTVFEPGRIELLLSKPVSRPRLLLGRYFGTLAVIACNMFYLVLGVWAVLGVKTHIWNLNFLLAAVLAVFAFAVLLTVVLLVAVLSSSGVLATMVAYFFLIMSVPLAQHAQLAPLFRRPWAREVVKWLYYVFPKIYDLGNMARLAMEGKGFQTWMPVWSSGVFAMVMLTAGLWFFARKDY
ncbi:MAG: ABC transporter permease subunit [Acidobacteria bacterium]|nr:ABC transporter permease subunit [Acidobacteriota bacterium]